MSRAPIGIVVSCPSLVVLVACGDDEPGTRTTDTSTTDTSPSPSDTSTSTPDTVTSDVITTDAKLDTAGPTCLTLAPGHQRHLVVARPYAEPSGAQADRCRAAALLYAAKNATALVLRPDGTHLVAAREAIDTTFGALHLVQPGVYTWRRLDTAHPFDFVVSPHGDVVLVIDGVDDAVSILDYDPDADVPFVDLGEPDYVTQRPQLPGDAVLVGDLHPDLVFVAENQAIRRLRFDGAGAVTDLGRTAVGVDSYDAIPGAIGMQPR